MSDFNCLLAISFLVLMGSFFGVWLARMGHDLAIQVVTGVAGGTPLSPRARKGILFHMWLPAEGFASGVNVFLALAFIQMADHVSGADVKLLAYLAALIAACASGFVFVSALFAFFQYRAMLHRVKQRQAATS